MLIDLSQPRKDYFKRWTTRQILLQFLDRNRFLPKHLLEVEKRSVMTPTEDLEALLEQRGYEEDHLSTISKVNLADQDTLLVFPPGYKWSAGDSRREIIYHYQSSLVPLHHSASSKKTASEVVEEAFAKLHHQKGRFINNNLIGYGWVGGDGLLRVVPLMNDVKGFELRAFQNLAWYQLGFPELEAEVRREIALGELNAEDRKACKARKYRTHLDSLRGEGRTLQHYVNQLQVRLRDTIRISPIERERVMNFFVPSRTDIYDEHDVKICNIPLRAAKDRDQLVWRLYGECDCLDQNYRSDRSGDGRKEFYFCPHEIAALQTFKAVLEQRGQRERIHSLPFPVPTRSLMDFIDKLRYRAIIIDYDADSGKPKMRPLNDTEIGVLAMKKITAEGYERNATTDPHAFRSQGQDPTSYLIRFRGTDQKK